MCEEVVRLREENELLAREAEAWEKHGQEETFARERAERADKQLREAALRTVYNAFGTKPRHTRARNGGCRDDCIPCGIVALARLFPDNGIAVRVVSDLRPVPEEAPR